MSARFLELLEYRHARLLENSDEIRWMKRVVSCSLVQVRKRLVCSVAGYGLTEHIVNATLRVLRASNVLWFSGDETLCRG